MVIRRDITTGAELNLASAELVVMLLAQFHYLTSVPVSAFHTEASNRFRWTIPLLPYRTRLQSAKNSPGTVNIISENIAPIGEYYGASEVPGNWLST